MEKKLHKDIVILRIIVDYKKFLLIHVSLLFVKFKEYFFYLQTTEKISFCAKIVFNFYVFNCTVLITFTTPVIRFDHH